MFVLGLPTVDTEGDDDFHILIPDPGGVEPLHQKQQIDLAAGVARDVRGDDHHPLSRPEPGDDRITPGKCRSDYRGRRTGWGRYDGTNCSEEFIRRKIQGEGYVTVSKFHGDQ